MSNGSNETDDKQQNSSDRFSISKQQEYVVPGTHEYNPHGLLPMASILCHNNEEFIPTSTTTGGYDDSGCVLDVCAVQECTLAQEVQAVDSIDDSYNEKYYSCLVVGSNHCMVQSESDEVTSYNIALMPAAEIATKVQLHIEALMYMYIHLCHEDCVFGCTRSNSFDGGGIADSGGGTYTAFMKLVKVIKSCFFQYATSTVVKLLPLPATVHVG